MKTLKDFGYELSLKQKVVEDWEENHDILKIYDMMNSEEVKE